MLQIIICYFNSAKILFYRVIVRQIYVLTLIYKNIKCRLTSSIITTHKNVVILYILPSPLKCNPLISQKWYFRMISNNPFYIRMQFSQTLKLIRNNPISLNYNMCWLESRNMLIYAIIIYNLYQFRFYAFRIQHILNKR